ncbi:MAG: hypothetical protein CMC08_00320 [Flavobacteriaceae bacterium]|nr:hypothetical protein [Flavobacteriaceae bacterium]
MTTSKKRLIFKVTVLIIAFIIAIYCFMIKLPVPFRKIDTQLHALFFFLASAFINILFLVRDIKNHVLIFSLLFLFSTLIEFAQEYSNTLVHRTIHGNFDPIDLKFNLIGLSIFSLIWFTYYTITWVIKKYIYKRQRV